MKWLLFLKDKFKLNVKFDVNTRETEMSRRRLRFQTSHGSAEKERQIWIKRINSREMLIKTLRVNSTQIFLVESYLLIIFSPSSTETTRFFLKHDLLLSLQTLLINEQVTGGLNIPAILVKENFINKNQEVCKQKFPFDCH